MGEQRHRRRHLLVLAGSSNPAHLTNVNGTLFFAANDTLHGTELWESNGTAAGTFMVKDIIPGNGSTYPYPSGSYPTSLTNVNGTLLFAAGDDVVGTELCESNGTAAGTFFVRDINPGTSGSNPSYLTNVNGTLFFAANDGIHGHELWSSDGTAGGTQMYFINPSSSGSAPTQLTNVGGKLFFLANDGTHGVEPWVFRANHPSPRLQARWRYSERARN